MTEENKINDTADDAHGAELGNEGSKYNAAIKDNEKKKDVIIDTSDFLIEDEKLDEDVALTKEDVIFIENLGASSDWIRVAYGVDKNSMDAYYKYLTQKVCEPYKLPASSIFAARFHFTDDHISYQHESWVLLNEVGCERLGELVQKLTTYRASNVVDKIETLLDIEKREKRTTTVIGAVAATLREAANAVEESKEIKEEYWSFKNDCQKEKETLIRNLEDSTKALDDLTKEYDEYQKNNLIDKDGKSKKCIDDCEAKIKKAIADKDKIISNKDKTISDKDKTISDKDKTIYDKDNQIRNLNENSVTAEVHNRLKEGYGRLLEEKKAIEDKAASLNMQINNFLYSQRGVDKIISEVFSLLGIGAVIKSEQKYKTALLVYHGIKQELLSQYDIGNNVKNINIKNGELLPIDFLRMHDSASGCYIKNNEVSKNGIKENNFAIFFTNSDEGRIKYYSDVPEQELDLQIIRYFVYKLVSVLAPILINNIQTGAYYKELSHIALSSILNNKNFLSMSTYV